jgi:hypothetical protein
VRSSHLPGDISAMSLTYFSKIEDSYVQINALRLRLGRSRLFCEAMGQVAFATTTTRCAYCPLPYARRAMS